MATQITTGTWWKRFHRTDGPASTHLIIHAHGVATNRSWGLDTRQVPSGVSLHFYCDHGHPLMVSPLTLGEAISGKYNWVQTVVPGHVTHDYYLQNILKKIKPGKPVVNANGPTEAMVQTAVDQSGANGPGRAAVTVDDLGNNVKCDALTIPKGIISHNTNFSTLLPFIKRWGYTHVHCLFCRGNQYGAQPPPNR